MPKFSRAVILASTDYFSNLTHQQIDRFLLEHGLERVSSAAESKVGRATTVAAHLIKNPELTNDYGENLVDTVVTDLVERSLDSTRGYGGAFDAGEFENRYRSLARALKRDGIAYERGVLGNDQPPLEVPEVDWEAEVDAEVAGPSTVPKESSTRPPEATNKLREKITSGNFDVFLAHNTLDKSDVAAVSESLKQRGLYPWLDKEQVPPGRWFQDIIQTAIPQVKSAAVFIGPNGLGRWQAVELRGFVAQCVERGIPVIPVLLPGVTSIPGDLVFLNQLHSVAFPSLDNEDALDGLEWGITGKHPKR
jgi:hypothetical protein